jgi:hypothetical protein
MKDVFNIDKTILFYKLQSHHSLTTKQYKGKKQDKKRLVTVIFYYKDGYDKILLW